MANGLGFSGGLARGLQRSFPDVGGIMREERNREEERRRKEQEKEEKRLLDTARIKAQENMDAADKIIESAKSGIQFESLDEKELTDLRNMYISFVQNANLDRSTLGIGPIPGHNADGSTFDMAVQNVETRSQKLEREQQESIAEQRALRPEAVETARATSEARARVQTEEIRRREELGLGDSSTRLQPSASNSARATAVQLFGGIIDPLTGQPTGIDQGSLISAMRVAARAEQMLIENPNMGIVDATMRAFDEAQNAVQSPSQTGAVQQSTQPAPQDRVAVIMQQQPNITRERAEALAAQMEAQQSVPVPQTSPVVTGENMFSGRLNKVITEADFQDTVAEIMQQQPNMSRERAEQAAREMLEIR